MPPPLLQNIFDALNLAMVRPALVMMVLLGGALGLFVADLVQTLICYEAAVRELGIAQGQWQVRGLLLLILKLAALVSCDLVDFSVIVMLK